MIFIKYNVSKHEDAIFFVAPPRGHGKKDGPYALFNEYEENSAIEKKFDRYSTLCNAPENFIVAAPAWGEEKYCSFTFVVGSPFYPHHIRSPQSSFYLQNIFDDFRGKQGSFVGKRRSLIKLPETRYTRQLSFLVYNPKYNKSFSILLDKSFELIQRRKK